MINVQKKKFEKNLLWSLHLIYTLLTTVKLKLKFSEQLA